MEENKKHKFPYFTICFYTALAVLNVYLFLCHPTGICVYWGFVTVLAMWNLKGFIDEEEPAILIIWQTLQVALLIILIVAFGFKLHVLAIAGLPTFLLHGTLGVVFDCSKNPDEVSSIILTAFPIITGYLIMTVCLINNIPF